MSKIYSPELLTALAQLDTCAIADSIERTDVRMRNEGFSTSDHLRCHFPDLPPMVGYATTLRVRSANPPLKGGRYPEHPQWWELLPAVPEPRVLVIQDIDAENGTGAFVGETHGVILRALGFVGVVTNGAVRSLPVLHQQHLALFSRKISPSHGYIHIVEHGISIEVAGLQVAPGDLLHGDQHGVIRIPHRSAEQIPEIARQIASHKSAVLELCASRDFSEEKLHALLSAQQS